MDWYAFLKVFIAKVTATVLMTIFTYGVSFFRKKDFKEPEIINHLLRPIKFLKIKNEKWFLGGWALHFFFGVMFVTAYHFIWENNYYGSTFLSACELGAATGIFWLITWTLIFKYHPSPPKINLKEFYIPIFLSHVVFGIGAWLGYHILP
ncbi:MAG TPA: hypothetical protein PK325_17820 [Cyclobacteriaceae bacterium]|nr:hypothetical protein [Cyclobacteriaceae bacterium]HMV11187.1 hypothetical protein [Cyclobacteriaceae bacterium]HMX01721.1 hypothetical protein [Cyclobacteriaceae bacterium]HMX51398.1 hypothetical protein [Cyclobacteriaceae bacterium]HMY95545.1 hypothetical protein [Cyclobacteriaceae bacterium]